MDRDVLIKGAIDMRFVSVNCLKEGQVVGKDVLNDNGVFLVKEGVALRSNHIRILKEIGYSGIYIADDLSSDIEIEEIIDDKTRKEIFLSAKKVLENAKKSKAENLEFLTNQVLGVIEELLQNKNAKINLLDLKTFDNYTFQHSVSVAIYSILIGMSLNYSKDELKKLGMAAILHDIGKVLIPDEVLNKVGKLTDEEFSLIKSHSKKGYDYIKEHYYLEATVNAGILQHHEKYDGTGYPLGLKGDKISKFARIIAIADVYDALVSNRPYRRAMAPSEALEILYANSGTHFDPDMLNVFVRKIMPYPLGTIIRLSDNNIYIVIENIEGFNSRPIVRNVATNKVIDLSKDLTKVIVEVIEDEKEAV